MAQKRCMGCMNCFNIAYNMCPHCGYVDGTPAKEAYHIQPGSLLHNRYTVGRSIGYGGFGVTYIAWDNKLERCVAIKEYMPSDYATRVPGSVMITIYDGERHDEFMTGLQKFLEEAQRLAQLKETPGIVQILDTFSENMTAYIVMEYLSGKTLKDYLSEKGGRMEYDKAIKIILPVLAALAPVHKAGIIHRDISPDNIFLTDGGEVKLLDFGAARYASTGYSKSLSVILKPGYAPEEQYFSHGKQGPWSDVYAAAATLYRMLTGVVPEEALERKENDALKRPSSLGVRLPKSAENAILNALNIKAERRTQTAEEFEAQLLATTKVIRIPDEKRRRFSVKMPAWLRIMLAAVGLLAAAGVFLVATGTLKLGLGGRLVFDTSLFKDGDVNTPGVINLTEDEGTTAAHNAGMQFYIIGAKGSNTVKQGIIMSQSPNPGEKVQNDEKLSVEISTGPQYAMIPDIVDTLWSDSAGKIKSAGFVAKIFEQNDDFAPEGAVMEMGHEAGTNFQVGEKIKIVVSLGPKEPLAENPVVMPRISDMNYEEAKQALHAVGLRVLRTDNQYSTTVPKGGIIAQDINAGEKLTSGDIVRLTVSMGVEQTSVPNLQYMDRKAAIAALTAAKLQYTIAEQESDTVKEGLILSQSIAADQVVDIETNVDIVISLGRREDVPHMVGASLDRVKTELSALGFENVTYTGKYDVNTTKNTVMTQSVPAGTHVNVADALEVVYSMGKMPVAVTFDAAGGSVNSSGFTVYYPATYGTLPTPTRAYYTFVGWYAQDTGMRVTNSSAIPEKEFVTLYAQWEENPLSNWIRASDVPSDAQIVNRKYTYTQTEYATSDKSSMSGWTLYDSKWELSDYGNWSDWSTVACAASENRKVETRREQASVVDGYNMVEYHTQGASSPYYRHYRSYSIGGDYSGYGARSSYGEHNNRKKVSRSELDSAPRIYSGDWSSGNAAGQNMDSQTGYQIRCSGYDFIFFIESESYSTTTVTYYRYADRVEKTVYYFKRDVNREDSVRPGGSDITNIVEYVQYRNR